jgi:hypothetical protein
MGHRIYYVEKSYRTYSKSTIAVVFEPGTTALKNDLSQASIVPSSNFAHLFDIVKAVKLQSKVWYRFGKKIKNVNESV